MKKNIQISKDIVKSDFEKCRKECLELWYKTINRHIQARPDLVDNKIYNAIANSYKPFEDKSNV